VRPLTSQGLNGLPMSLAEWCRDAFISSKTEAGLDEFCMTNVMVCCGWFSFEKVGLTLFSSFYRVFAVSDRSPDACRSACGRWLRSSWTPF
jgi:hypothetical protein